MSAGVTPEWLALREPADAAARARELVDRLARVLRPTGRRMIHDLGCGTGAMGRWLAPLLPGPQHWVGHDRDAHLLALAAGPPGPAADDAAVTMETKHTDLAQLHPRDLAGASLITASALLDVLTKDETTRLAQVCASARCPVLLTLSVTGQVEITPADALDRRVCAAFNDHQRRTTDRGRLLGPDAVAVMTEEFGGLGAEVLVRPSPWRLAPAHASLVGEWLSGWVGAAGEQEIELAAEHEAYTRQRLAQLNSGKLRVTVGHADILVLP